MNGANNEMRGLTDTTTADESRLNTDSHLLSKRFAVGIANIVVAPLRAIGKNFTRAAKRASENPWTAPLELGVAIAASTKDVGLIQFENLKNTLQVIGVIQKDTSQTYAQTHQILSAGNLPQDFKQQIAARDKLIDEISKLDKNINKIEEDPTAAGYTENLAAVEASKLTKEGGLNKLQDEINTAGELHLKAFLESITPADQKDPADPTTYRTNPYSKITEKDGVMTLEAPHEANYNPFTWWNAGYGSSKNDLLGDDLLILAQGIKLAGRSKIEMNLEFAGTPAEQDKYLQKMATACKLAGFKDDQISLTLNGTPIAKEKQTGFISQATNYAQALKPAESSSSNSSGPRV